MYQKYILSEIKELSTQIKELNGSIQKKSEKWSIIKWIDFKLKFSKHDFYGRCQTETFKYFSNTPKRHSCALCQN